MSDQERGAYAPPTDAPLTFDDRQPIRGAPAGPPWALIISALVLLAVVGAIFVFYRSGVRHGGEAAQVVGTPLGPMKAAAPDQEQPRDPAAGLQIYRSEPGQPPEPTAAAPQFAPPPEQPQPRTTLPPVVIAPPAAPPVATAPASAAPSPPAPAAAPSKPVPTAPPSSLRPAAQAPKAEASKPAAAKAAAAPTKTVDSILANASGGGAAVQIGAYSSQALADKGWKDATAIAGGGKGKSVEKIEKDGSALYRTAVTGFASRADAQAYCAKLKAAAKSCFVR